MIIRFDLSENTSLGSVLKKISYSQNPYCRKAPSFCPHRRKKAFLRDFFNFMPNFHILSQQVKPIISKGWSRGSFCFFFSLERFPKSILVVWPREWYQINPRNIWNKRIEPIFDWRSQIFFWDLQSSLTVSFSHAWMSKWVKNSFRNFKNPFLRSKNQIFFLTQ